MKKYNDFQSAKDDLKNYIEYIFTDKEKNFNYNSVKMNHFIKLISSILLDSYDEFKDNYLFSNKSDNGYSLSRIKLYKSGYYSFSTTLLSFVRDYRNTENLDCAKNRGFFLVGDKVIHMLELSNITLTELKEFVNNNEVKTFIGELIYEYAVHTKNYDLAKTILQKLILESSDFSIESDNMMDYWPLLSSPSLVKQLKKNNLQNILTNYLKSVSGNALEFPIDYEINERIINMYKKQLKNATVSMYSTAASIKENNVSIFDILESNLATRKSLLKFENWDDIREFRNLKEKDENRLHKIVISYFNTEHRNGIRKSKFIRVYKKIKSEMEIDVFSLNPKLQTYVLLEEIS